MVKQKSGLNKKLSEIDWSSVSADLNARGYAHISNIFPSALCDGLIGKYDDSKCFRKTVVMARHRFGLGEYKYFDYPLPEEIQAIRKLVYPKLAPVTNNWMDKLRIDKKFPSSFSDLLDLCHAKGQTKATPLILKYGKGGHNTLHQDLYGEVY
ncbi:MAG: 2OG-Fe(II) oxygenase, partial [Pyrinomonadaceae bacterium]